MARAVPNALCCNDSFGKAQICLEWHICRKGYSTWDADAFANQSMIFPNIEAVNSMQFAVSSLTLTMPFANAWNGPKSIMHGRFGLWQSHPM